MGSNQDEAWTCPREEEVLRDPSLVRKVNSFDLPESLPEQVHEHELAIVHKYTIKGS